MALFPNSKTVISFGPLSIQWYAICIIVGAYIAYLIAARTFKKRGYNAEILSDYFFGVLLVGVVGARIWYVIFMFNEIYRYDLMGIFNIRNGGLAIQGGIIAGLIYSWSFFKRKKIAFLEAGDAILPGVLLAQALGRWGNFFNQEAYGNAVSLEHLRNLHIPEIIIRRMHIMGHYYQPTFLYESVLNVIGFLLIYFLIRKFQRKQGTLFYSYFIWYGITRFWVEGMRSDSLFFLGLKMAQITSVAFVIVGVVGCVWCYQKGRTIQNRRQYK